ncbi:MAG: hypothetical protein V1766_10135 [Pseudomonadota bacterium]
MPAIRKRRKILDDKDNMTFNRDQSCRWLPVNLARLVLTGFFIFLVGACASSRAAPDKDAGPGIAVISASPADAVMLNEGISRLGLKDKPADYAKARETFAALTKDYPKSRWRPLAETFICLIDAIQSLQMESLSAREIAEKLKQDNERLKKDIQALSNRVQAEHASLMQENENLKKDMELLKKLEVQLDKRERMLR